MRHFVLYRREDETGVSGTGVVAEGVMFDSGLIAVSWLTERTSIAVYRSMDDVRAIHGHGGNTEVVELAYPETYARAAHDCIQDRCENAPFSSVGGLDRRVDMRAPEYIEGTERRRCYVLGYAARARRLFGKDWQTCAFGWKPALTIGAT